MKHCKEPKVIFKGFRLKHYTVRVLCAEPLLTDIYETGGFSIVGAGYIEIEIRIAARNWDKKFIFDNEQEIKASFLGLKLEWIYSAYQANGMSIFDEYLSVTCRFSFNTEEQEYQVSEWMKNRNQTYLA